MKETESRKWKINGIKPFNHLPPVVILWALFAILFLFMGIGLCFEERYRQAIGMFILSGMLLFWILLASMNLEKYRMNKMAKIIKGKRKKQGENSESTTLN